MLWTNERPSSAWSDSRAHYLCCGPGERNQASSGARPGVRLVTLFYQTNILLFVSRQIMVLARGLPPAQHLALLYDDQSLQKELSPWNKADKIGRQWRCCSLSLVSPLSPESPRNVEIESDRKCEPCEKPGASQRWPDFSRQLHFMVSKCQLQEKEDLTRTKKVGHLPRRFLATVTRYTCFI